MSPVIAVRRLGVLFGCFVIASVITEYLVMQLYLHALTFYDYVLALVAVAVFVAAIVLFHRHFPNPKRVAQLTEMIHREVCHQISLGYTKLCPPGGTRTQTFYLRISVTGDGIAVIEQFDWHVYRNDQKNRRILAVGRDGRVWNSGPLVRHLEELLVALCEYEPRYKVDKVVK